jgi:hypothetical protein
MDERASLNTVVSGAKLTCGHSCPSKCHQIYDHSKMPCEEILYDKCSSGHQLQWKCQSSRPDSCSKCEKDAKEAEKRRREQFKLQEKRDREDREHARALAQIDAEIASQREIIRDAQLAEERRQAILQKQQDLQDAIAFAKNATSVPTSPPHPSSAISNAYAIEANVDSGSSALMADENDSKPQTVVLRGTPIHVHKDPQQASATSSARADWERQKAIEGASSDAIDAIMEMTGLEKVKSQVLDIKASVDTAKRQGIAAKGRYNLALLGNPGTGTICYLALSPLTVTQVVCI